jgi:hypothetical protein
MGVKLAICGLHDRSNLTSPDKCSNGLMLLISLSQIDKLTSEFIFDKASRLENWLPDISRSVNFNPASGDMS